MPRYNIEPKVNRRDARRQQTFENDAVETQQQQAGQNGMLQQLQALYNISQDQQQAPLKAAQMEAQTRGVNAASAAQEFENQWAQPNAEAAYNLKAAQTGALSAKQELQPPHGFEFLPPEAQRIALEHVYPELAVQRQQKAQHKNAAAWMDTEQQARAGGVNPEETMLQWGPDNLQYLQSLVPQKPMTATPVSNVSNDAMIQSLPEGQRAGAALGQAFARNFKPAVKKLLTTPAPDYVYGN